MKAAGIRDSLYPFVDTWQNQPRLEFPKSVATLQNRDIFTCAIWNPTPSQKLRACKTMRKTGELTAFLSKVLMIWFSPIERNDYCSAFGAADIVFAASQ
jgi:hypothetical protein